MSSSDAVAAADVSFRYGERLALSDIELRIGQGEIHGLLGPNGGGKTTLFRLLSTLIPLQAGNVWIMDRDLRSDPAGIRLILGVTFQSPSLDRKLTVGENLRHQGHLYGLSGHDLTLRSRALLERLGVLDRFNDRVETLSGGQQRRVEIAKGLLHDPRLLLLDEPSTGLDPGARRDLWNSLLELRRDTGVTILVTTHLMDEAEHCDRLTILDRGKIVAWGTPEELRESVGGDCLTIQTPNPDSLAASIAEKFQLQPRRLGDALRIERPRAHELLTQLMDSFGGDITSVSIGKPTLEDVFIQRTGHQFWQEVKS